MIVLATTLTVILITSAPKKDWSNDDPNIKCFPFNEDDGMKIAAPDGDDTLFYFKLLVTDQLLNCFVQRSNEYAHSIINSSHPLPRNSILNSWKDITLVKINKLFGLIFHMDLLALSSDRSYWSTDLMYKNELFKYVMCKYRFLAIMCFLHFGEESTYKSEQLSKIRFLLNHLNNTVPEIVIPHQNLSIDESMMLWRG